MHATGRGPCAARRRGFVSTSVLLVCAAVLDQAACEDPCAHGDGPGVDVQLGRGDAEPSNYCQSESWDLHGDAEVTELSTEGNHTLLGLWFTNDATSVRARLLLPPDASLPLRVGDPVVAGAGVSCPWWSNEGLSVSAPSGELLVRAYSGGDYLAKLPKACDEELLCGTVGYPELTFTHPLAGENPAAPVAHLKEGEEATLTFAGLTYRIVLGHARTWVTFTCSDMPQTEVKSLVLLASPLHSAP